MTAIPSPRSHHQGETDMPNLPSPEDTFVLAALGINPTAEQRQDLLAVFTPEAIRDHAHEFYGFMHDNALHVDSWTREAAFSYASEKLGIDYDVCYSAWLNRTPVERPWSASDKAVLDAGADLLSDDGENPEYDRAIAELCCVLIGLTTDYKDAVLRDLRAAKATKEN